MSAIRLEVGDPELARRTLGELRLGKAFAFVTPETFAAPALAWVPRLLGAPVGASVVALLGGDPLPLPGVTVHPAAVPTLGLRSLTSDRSLYREGRDVVRLLALDLLAPGAERVIEVDHQGRDFGRYPVTLDASGAAVIELRDLPAGDFAARVRDAGGDDVTFAVAVYRLAPLVASLVDRQLDGARLRVRLRLETHGVAVEGPVLVELHEAGRRLGRERVEARGGVAEAQLTLEGAGPHELVVQLADDASRTASIPLVGSRASERAKTRWSTFAETWDGALLPGADRREVRGVYLSPGPRSGAPLRLSDVVGASVRLTAVRPIEAARLVIVDPTFPARRPDAIDPAAAPHPGEVDVAYQRAEKLFQQGKYAEARVLFELPVATRPVAHPNFAYYVACCHARLGDRSAAVASLRTAIEHGWRDLAYLGTDDDLASLRGLPAFETLVGGGRREQPLGALAAGAEVTVEGLGPLSILAVGAVVEGQPWEGWAALLAPSEVTARVVAPEMPSPGGTARIDVEVGLAHPRASVHVIVRDARLLAPDTPLNRLAGRLKQCVSEAGARLGDGNATSSLASRLPATPPPFWPPPPPSYDERTSVTRAGMLAPPNSFGGPALPRSPSAIAPPLPGAARAMPVPPGSPPLPPAPSRPMVPSASYGSSVRTGGPEREASLGAPAPALGGPAGYGPAPMPPMAPMAAPAAPGPAAAEQGAGRAERAPVAGEEPAVVFAGLVEARDGQATIEVTLGPDPADYVVEAFVLAGGSWARVEHRFRADRVPSVALEVATFVQAGDTAVGRAVVRGAVGPLRVRVLRDGVPVPLLHEGRPLADGATLAGLDAEVSFLVQAGDHEAVVEDVGTGAADWARRRVDEPGRLRRLARTVRLLEPGQRVALGDDPSVRALRVLPGLDRPFGALLEATASFDHACCEQTAAKVVAACAMLLVARTADARSRAEAIVLAGVRREQTMWLPGRGFRMYPGSPPEPNAHWSPKAALHLWWLAAARDALTGPSKALLTAIEDGLRMAADATAAHRIAWPPSRADSPESAYLVARFGADPAARAQALAWVRSHLSGDAIQRPVGAVQRRIDLSYLAATLLRLGGPGDRGAALALTNEVTRELGPEGRLYSTADSVAAIALLGELRAARIGDGGGRAEVNGVRLTGAEVARSEGETRTVAAVEGVVAVEELRVVDERWDALPSTVPVSATIERDGRPVRRVAPGQELSLRVKLTGSEGYRAGDLVWVSLPDALSRVLGGGQVKLFSVDLAGRTEIEVPLAATGLTVGPDGQPAPQHFAVCVRNMFEQERAGLPSAPLDITVEGAASSALGRLVRGVKGLFGS